MRFKPGSQSRLTLRINGEALKAQPLGLTGRLVLGAAGPLWLVSRSLDQAAKM